MSAKNWKRIAATRLKEIQRLERAVDLQAAHAGAIVEQRLSTEVHSRCLFSIAHGSSGREAILAVSREVAKAFLEPVAEKRRVSTTPPLRTGLVRR